MSDPIVSGPDAGAQRPSPEPQEPMAPTVIIPATDDPQPLPGHPHAGVGGPATAGWFGKLPMLGDFASRRLPETFIRPWDDWLQAALANARDATGQRWLDLYLTFPVWRFVMPAGLAGDTAWVGVLLPSVDRVGRCFPLTIGEPVDPRTLDSAGLIGIDAHLSHLADAGIEALDAGAVEFLERRLGGLAPLQPDADRSAIALEAWSPRSRQSMPLPGPATAWSLKDPIATALSSAASRYVIAALGRRVLWWSPPGGPDDANGARGALRLEQYPLSSNLLADLIGTD